MHLGGSAHCSMYSASATLTTGAGWRCSSLAKACRAHRPVMTSFVELYIHVSNDRSATARSTRPWAERPPTSIGLIKIDTQGAEPQVLAGAVGAIRKHRPLVYYEQQFLPASDRGGTLLQRLLGGGAGAAYGCRCDWSDCECSDGSHSPL